MSAKRPSTKGRIASRSNAPALAAHAHALGGRDAEMIRPERDEALDEADRRGAGAASARALASARNAIIDGLRRLGVHHRHRRAAGRRRRRRHSGAGIAHGGGAHRIGVGAALGLRGGEVEVDLATPAAPVGRVGVCTSAGAGSAQAPPPGLARIAGGERRPAPRAPKPNRLKAVDHFAAGRDMPELQHEDGVIRSAAIVYPRVNAMRRSLDRSRRIAAVAANRRCFLGRKTFRALCWMAKRYISG